MTTEQIEVTDNRDASRYELRVGGVDAGFIDYVLTGDVMIMSYIEIDPAFGGQGFGSRLTKTALDDCRSRELTVVPTCPFIADYIRTHPEYAEWSKGQSRSS